MDSKLPDAQAAHEFTLTGLMTALAGANLIYGVGMLELGITFDFAQAVMDNEMARMIRRAVDGITITDETLAVDIIKQVGAAGEYVTHKNTYDNMRIHSQSKLIDRRMRQGWLDMGAKDFTERAYEEACSILTNHKPDPLPEGVEATLRSIVEEAEEEFGVK